MDDRELLELAAKSAGLNLECFHNDVLGWELWNGDCWNPLTDDGDAFRLVIQLKVVGLWKDATQVEPKNIEGFWDGDPCAATRRSIVRAAAALSSTSHGQGSASDGSQR